MNKYLSIGLAVCIGCNLGDYEVGPLPPPDLSVQPECTPGDSQTCNTDLPGICASGSQLCLPAGKWGSCIASDKPGTIQEKCDGFDNDCDGKVDNGLFWKDPVTNNQVPVGAPCCPLPGVCCDNKGTVQCANGSPACVGDSTRQDDKWHSDAKNNSFDWNCDGRTDVAISYGGSYYNCSTDCRAQTSEADCYKATILARCDPQDCGKSSVTASYCKWDTNKCIYYSSTGGYTIVCK